MGTPILPQEDWDKINPQPNGPNGAQMFIEQMRESVAKEGKEGGSWYHTYQANIAMAFYDTYCNSKPHTSKRTKAEIHNIANRAAMNFLDLLLYKPNPEDPELPGMLELSLRMR